MSRFQYFVVYVSASPINVSLYICLFDALGECSSVLMCSNMQSFHLISFIAVILIHLSKAMKEIDEPIQRNLKKQ